MKCHDCKKEKIEAHAQLVTAVTKKVWVMLGVRAIYEIATSEPNMMGLRVRVDTQEHLDAICENLVSHKKRIESTKPGKQGYDVYLLDGVEVIFEA